MSRMMKKMAMVVTAMLVVADVAAQIPDDLYEYPEVSIDGSTASSVEVVRDSAGLLAYRYSVDNARSSDAGIKAFLVDVSAPRAVSPEILFTRGRFRGDATRNADAPSSHVPLALEIPDPWSGFVHADGWVKWRSPMEFVRATAPVEPGSSRADLVLRSSYLPGIRRYRLLPDYPHLCCRHAPGDPRNAGIDAREAADFQVTGVVVAPTYAPADINLQILVGLLARACGELAWISNRDVCRGLQVKLELSVRSFERGRPEAARGRLRSFLEKLNAEHGIEPGKHVNENAYQLLGTNVEYLLGKL